MVTMAVCAWSAFTSAVSRLRSRYPLWSLCCVFVCPHALEESRNHSWSALQSERASVPGQKGASFMLRLAGTTCCLIEASSIHHSSIIILRNEKPRPN